MIYHYIDIGCSDFFNSFYRVDPNENAIMVDPNLEALVRIPNMKNVIKAPFAILDETRLDYLFYISRKTIRKHRLPYWMYGCASIGRIHPTLQNREISKDLIEIQPVLVLSWVDFLQMYNITEIVNLNIDIEGMDHLILKQNLETKIPIQNIMFEMNSLSSPELVELIEKYKELGYEFKKDQGEDYILTKI